MYKLYCTTLNLFKSSLIFLFVLFALNQAEARIVYVKPIAVGDSSGTSWANASTLAEAMLSAQSGDSIWVAAGIYIPKYDRLGNASPVLQQYRTFFMQDGTFLYGGFNGTETSLEQRNWKTNECILSGNIGSPTDSTDNCYHVVWAIAPYTGGGGVTIDGFTITGGYAGLGNIGGVGGVPGYSSDLGCGAGILLHYGTNFVRNNKIVNNICPNNDGGGIRTLNGINLIANNVISANRAQHGGAIHSFLSSNTFINNIICNNRASVRGGGISEWHGQRFIASQNIIFNNVSDSLGGGAYLDNDTTIVSSNLIHNNIASYRCGGIYIYNAQQAIINNNTISLNRAKYSGGLIGGSILCNNIFKGNTQDPVLNISVKGADFNGQAVLINNILQFAESIYGTIIKTGSSGNLFQTNPQFLDELNPAGPDNILRTADDGLRVKTTSIAINGGDSTFTGNIPYDVTGSSRRKLGTVDIGAYEFGCDSADTSGLSSVQISITSGTNPICSTHAVTLSATNLSSGLNVNYAWLRNGLVIPGKNTPSVSLIAGTDFLTTDTIQCVLNSSLDCFRNTPVATNKIVLFTDTAVTRFYVNADATGLNNGLSWTDAFTDLSAALNYPGCVINNIEIWVAAGTYIPSTDPFGNSSPVLPRDKTFHIKEGRRLYGGFTGTETLLSQRNSRLNPTILSGDIGIQNNNTDNCYHVVVASLKDTTQSITLDGFSITKGNANGVNTLAVNAKPFYRNSGGGLYIINGKNNISGNIISFNTATANGGGLLGDNISGTTDRNFILSNNSDYGGGICLLNGVSIIVHSNVIAMNNAPTGGGVVLTGTNKLINNTIYSNTASLAGGGISTPIGTNVIINNVLWNNKKGSSTSVSGSDYHSGAGNNTLTGNLLQLTAVNYPVTGAGHIGAAGKGNLFALNPYFKDSAKIEGTDSIYGTDDDGLSLKNISPCIDMGDSNQVNSINTDIKGAARVRLSTIDMGAYESGCDSAAGLVSPSLNITIGSGANPACNRTTIVLNAYAQYGGAMAKYQWVKNNILIPGKDSSALVLTAGSTLTDGDTIKCILTSNRGCLTKNNDTSAFIKFGVTPLASRLYVKANATGLNNGLSWNNAFRNLQSALEYSGCSDTTMEIWVAAGTYIPSKDPFGNANPTLPRDRTFYIKGGLQVYGGFAGTESSIEQRSLRINQTILSGDIGIPNDSNDNCYHVVIASATVSGKGFLFDGFTVKHGKSNGSGAIVVNSNSFSRSRGPGLFVFNGTNTITRNQFISNSSGSDGAGLLLSKTTSRVCNNLFFNNRSVSSGGGLTSEGTNVISNNLFHSNIAGSTQGGGGLYIFAGNHILNNNTFYSNSSSSSAGGGITIAGGTNSLCNSIFWNNKRSGTPDPSVQGSDYYRTGGNTSFKNNLLQGVKNNYTTTGSGNFDLGTTGGKNHFGIYPQFKDTNRLSGTDGIYGTADDGLRLKQTSIAIDAGDSTLWDVHDIIDFANASRISMNDVDIGAYEYHVDSLDVMLSAALIINITKGNNPACAADSVTFEATPQYPGANPSFQWRKNGIDIPGISSSTYTGIEGIHFSSNDTINCIFTSSRGGLLNNTATAHPVIIQRQNSIIYVNIAATGANNGLSWTDAFTDLQSALNYNCSNTQIWVATGIYKPTHDALGNNRPADPRDRTFYIKDGIKLYGGFTGTETSLQQRSKNNITTLSGDIGLQNDSTDNCYHVLFASTTSTGIGVTIDGFTITKGRANGSSFFYGGPSIIIQRNTGAGIFLVEGKNTISNNIFLLNSSMFSAGAVFMSRGSNMFSENILINNTTSGMGGGIVANSGTDTFINNVFYNNSGNQGGALFLDGVNTFNNNTIYGNSASADGGGIYSSGGLNNFYNTILWNNKKGTNSTTPSSDYYRSNGTNTFKNNLLQLIANNYTPASLGTGAVNNIFGINPQFTNGNNVAGADGIYQTSDDGLMLKRSSSCIDAGDSNLINGLNIDITGSLRNKRSNIDLGAYEYDCGSSVVLDRIYVNEAATGINNGTSWVNAFTNIQDALNYDCISASAEIWVAKGVYKPTHDPFGNSSPYDPRDKTFYLMPGLKMYGGFEGTENTIDQRNIKLNITILSGDIGIQNDSLDNCYHIIIASNNSNKQGVIVDGFTITKGLANGAGNIILGSNTILRNSGAGIYLTQGNNVISHNIISHNGSNQSGGAVYVDTATVFINANFIYSNTSANGAALFLAKCDNNNITNNVVALNKATQNGAGLYCYQGINTISNNTIYENTSLFYGGGLYTNGGANQINNVIFWNNKTNGSQQIASSDYYSLNSNNSFNNTLLQLKSDNYSKNGSGNYSIGASSKGNLFGLNPDFLDTISVAGMDNIPGTADDGLILKSRSVCIDAGDSNLLLAKYTDILLMDRIRSTAVDLGAYESDCNDSFQVTPLISISLPSSYATICANTTVTFIANTLYGGSAPAYQWTKNGIPITGAILPTYTAIAGADFFNDDTLTCILKSSRGCVITDISESSSLKAKVNNGIIYVNINATGANNGTSWRDAFTSLQSALNYNGCLTSQPQVWVAAGNYYPTHDPFNNPNPSDPRDKTFYVRSGFKLYGGFSGTEMTLNQRNIKTSITTLSGDIGIYNDSTDNCYHVVLGYTAGTNTGIAINGFHIIKGLANGINYITINNELLYRYNGAAIYSVQGRNIFAQNNFSYNVSNNGGAVYAYDGINNINSCYFYKNSCSGGGGGVCLSNGPDSVVNNTFLTNTANSGGALFSTTSNSISNYVANNNFIENISTDAGGAVCLSSGSYLFKNNNLTNNKSIRGGGIFSHSCILSVINNQFNNNIGTKGGAAHFWSGPYIISNNIFRANTSSEGGGIYSWFGSYTISNNLFLKNTANSGGGYYSENVTNTINNNTFFANSVTNKGGAIDFNSSPSSISNNIFYQNKRINSYIIQGADFQGNYTTLKNNSLQLSLNKYTNDGSSNYDLGTSGTNNLFGYDPIFFDTNSIYGTDSILGTIDDGFRLKSTSPCINAGDSTLAPNLPFDITGGMRIKYSNIDIGAYEFDSAAMLPVKLSRYIATRNKPFDELRWDVHSEKNISYYEVQRSFNRSDYEVMGVVKSRNNAINSSYTFKTPASSNEPQTYYRLKITELNGEYSYSKPVVINEMADLSHAITVQPNPVTNKVSIALSGNLLLQQVLVFDASGRHVQVQVTDHTINMETLEAGIYFVQVNTDAGTKVIKVLKQ